jgi:hypothetical protein
VSPLDPKDLSCQYHYLLPNQAFTHLVPLLSNPGSYIQWPHLRLIPPPHKYNKLSMISSKGVDRVLLCHVPPFQVHSLPRTSLSFQPRNPNGWAPAVQKIYDLAAFLPSSGTAKPKITSPKEWISTAHQLGQSMSASPLDHDFSWSEYICYIEMTTILFEHCEFSAVLNYDCTWRHWRCAYSKPWSAENAFARITHLMGHELPKGLVSPGTPISLKPKPTGVANVLLCFDFMGTSGCGCLTNCRYLHKCCRCKTTFPASVASCPCVNGTLLASLRQNGHI